MANSITTPQWPDFIIIGAAKSATTWINYQLRQNPDVFLPGPEPHYFSTEFHRGPDWYEGFFLNAAKGQAVGEKSADYLAHPEAARRIAQRLPGVRLIVQLRNPIERAYSDYCMFFRRGDVAADPERYLTRSRTEIPRFLEDGLYFRHLRRFLDFFPQDQIRAILYDDIEHRPDIAYRAVCEHIGVQEAPLSAVSEKVKFKEAPMLPLALRRLLKPVKHLAEPWRHNHWFEAARNRLAKPVDYPPLSDSLRQSLGDYYAYDVEELGRFLGRDMTAWLEPQAQEA
jgi:hypothetical protein